MNSYEQYLTVARPSTKRLLYQPDLTNIGECLSCGISHSHQRIINSNTQSVETLTHNNDHMLPRCILKHPYSISDGEKIIPLDGAVNSKDNLFRMCVACHQSIDRQKINIYLVGPGQVDPTGLIEFLYQQYPVSEDVRYRETQLHRMAVTFKRYVDTITAFKSDALPGSLVHAFKVSLPSAMAAERDFNRRYLAENDKNLYRPDRLTLHA